jgi:hypothetical protein
MGGSVIALVFCSYERPKRAVTFVARPRILVFVHCRVVALLVERLSTSGALEDVGWAAGTYETRGSCRSSDTRTPDTRYLVNSEARSRA